MKHALFALLFLVSACLPAKAQTYAIAPIPKINYTSNAGAILPNAKLCTLAAHSTTPQATYSDASGTANSNPVTLDSNGRANIFINSSAYKFILYNAGTGNTCNGSAVGTLVWSQDDIRDYGLVVIDEGVISGSGTAGTLPKFTATQTVGDSHVTETTGVLNVSEKLVIHDGTLPRLDFDVTNTLKGYIDATASVFAMYAADAHSGVTLSGGQTNIFRDDIAGQNVLTIIGTGSAMATTWRLGASDIGAIVAGTTEIDFCKGSCAYGVGLIGGQVNAFGASANPLSIISTGTLSAATWKANGADVGSIAGNSSAFTFCGSVGPCTAGVSVSVAGPQINLFAASGNVVTVASGSSLVAETFSAASSDVGAIAGNSTAISLCNAPGSFGGGSCTGGVGVRGNGSGVMMWGTSAGAPTVPSSSGIIYQFFIDSSDSNKLKVVSQGGTVTTVGTY